MRKVGGREFVHSTRGVLSIVLVATLMLGVFCLVGTHATRALGRAEVLATAAVGSVAVVVVEGRAAPPEGTRVPVISALASMLAAYDPAESGAVARTSWRALAAEVCRELLAADIL